VIYSELDPEDPDDQTPSSVVCLHCLVEDGDVQLARGLDLARRVRGLGALREEREPVRLGVSRFESAGELDGLRAPRTRIAVLERNEPIEIRWRALANGEPGDHAMSLGAVRR